MQKFLVSSVCAMFHTITVLRQNHKGVWSADYRRFSRIIMGVVL